uniref:Huntingtin n=1 Tax=Glossina palpalis gambiensis TaxID=67801 RepID=A0A1B0B3C5_9MUSC
MDKANIVNTFTEIIDQLRNTECSQEEKIACFQRIAEFITAPAMATQLNYATYISKATNVLLLFCEDLDSIIRMSAEENLNKIFRVLERTRVNRILMDLYGEIKRNGNQRSLRICLKIFAYYAQNIREHHIRWYAQNLLLCMQVIAKRKETQLQETLSEFVVKFGKYVQQGLTDSETCKLFEIFIFNVSSDCPVKRRSSAQNCINLIEHARNKKLMGEYALNKIMDLLLTDQQNTTIIGALGFLRQLIPTIVRTFADERWNDSDSSHSFSKSSENLNSGEFYQILEIYDYCLYLVRSSSTQNHTIINASLEVINAVLQCTNGSTSNDNSQQKNIGLLLKHIIVDKSLQHAVVLKKPNTLKNQILNLYNSEEENCSPSFNSPARASFHATISGDSPKDRTKGSAMRVSSDIAWRTETSKQQQQEEHEQEREGQLPYKRHTARSVSECVDIDYVDEEAQDDDDDFTTLSEINETQQHTHSSLANMDLTTTTNSTALSLDSTIDDNSNDAISGHCDERTYSRSLLVNFSDEKSNQLCNIDTDSVNSIEFKANISRGLVVEGINQAVAADDGYVNERNKRKNDSIILSVNKSSSSNSSTDAFQTFFNNINAASESVSKLFRHSSKHRSPTATDTASLTSTATSDSKRLESDIEVIDVSSPDTSKTFPTPSTAILDGFDSNEVSYNKAKDFESYKEFPMESTPLKRSIRNPFLANDSSFKDSSSCIEPQLPVDIGSMYVQSLIFYTARLISARFLLTGSLYSRHNDSNVRVSIKSISLNVLSQCVRLNPEILQIPLKFMSSEIITCVTKTSEDNDRCGMSNIEQGCEHLSASDSGGNTLDGTDFIRRSSFSSQLNVLKTEAEEVALLEIKDDHFGKSSNDFNFNSVIAKSADPVLFKCSKEVYDERKSLESKKKILSTSHIDDLDEFSNVDKDTIPIILPPKPPKRVKSLRKSKIIENAREREFPDNIKWKADGTQCLSDMLYLYNHHDPILRAGIQNIIGNYLLSNQVGLVVDMKINLQYLLAILCVGLEDEIHTVVVQALSTFDKIFPYVMSKYSKSPSRQCNRQQSKEDGQKPNKNVGCEENSKTKPTAGEDYHCSCCCYCFSSVSDADMTLPDFFQASSEKNIFRHFADNDEVISMLLKAFQLQSKFNCSINSSCAQLSSAIETEMLVNEKRTTTAGVSIGDTGADHNTSQENNAEELKSQQQKASTSSCVHCRSRLFFISPKLLLTKLRLCHNNKYWLVQTKYAEVISNLNFSAMHTYYGSCYNSFRDDFDNADYICSLKNSFMDELLQLIGDDDVRVREQAAKCLCHFIVQNAKQDRLHNVINRQSDHSNIPCTTTSTTTTATATITTTTTFAYNINFQLLANFFDYSIFNDMAPSLRYIFDNNLMFTKPTTTTVISHNSMENHLHREYIEGILSTILYRMTNKLMSLQDKNAQYGIIYAIKILLKHFTLTDFANVWFEFNFMEIFTKFSQYNYSTALDLTCQSDLIDVSSKLIVGCIIFNPDVQQYRDSNLCLLKHTMKIINIYYHLFTNQKPLIMAKGQKMDLFSNTKELAITQSIGYFGSEYIYMKLYQNLKSAYDNYRITINEEAGSKLISLLKSSLNSLNGCIEMLPHDGNKYVGVSGVNNGSNGGGGLAKNAPDANTVLPAATNALAAVPGLKLIEETLQYLTKVINYAPEECIACLRQLLKYLFARNYGNRQQGSRQQLNLQQHEQKRGHYLAFTKSYFTAKTKGLQNIIREDVESHQTKTTTTATIEIRQPPPLLSSLTWGCAHSVDGNKCGNDGSNNMPYNYLLLVELFASGCEFRTWKSENEAEFSKHIKFFEPIVMYCLTLFLKSNGRVQASILDLLTLLLDLNVTYNNLDAKNVIYDHVIKSLEIIENGIARNGQIVIGPMIRFLVKLSSKSERNVISMPKIISITNNLLANCNIRETAIEALKTLAYELFLIATNNPKHALRNIASNDCMLNSTHQATSDAKKQTNSLTFVTGNLLSHSDNNSSITSSRNNKELDTQKEVVLGMLEKFIESVDCQQVLSLLLLIEQLQQQQYHQQLQRQHSDTDSVESNFSLMREEDVLKQQMSCLPNPDVVCGMICQAICANRLRIRDWRDFCLADVFFKNNFKHLLSNSKDFMALLKFVIEVDVANFSDLSYATIILSNVILKTEEIYLVNHIKLYLKNHPAAIEKLRQKQNQHQQLTTTEHLLSSRCLLDIDNDKPSTSSAAAAVAQTYVSSNISEINYFATVLCGRLEDCLTILTSQQQTPLTFSRHFAAQYTHLAANFVHTLHKICFSSHLDNVLYTNMCSVLTTAESKFLNIYYNLLILNISQGIPASVLNANSSFSLMSSSSPSTFLILAHMNEYDDAVDSMLSLQIELFQLFSTLKLLDPLTLLERLQFDDICSSVRRALLQKLCSQYSSISTKWNLQQAKQLLNVNFLNILIVDQFELICHWCEVDEEFCSLFQNSLLESLKALNKVSGAIFIIKKNEGEKGDPDESEQQQQQQQQQELQFVILNDLENSYYIRDCDNSPLGAVPNIIDEEWICNQLIKFSTRTNYDTEQIVKVLLEIQTENKLQMIFNDNNFDVKRVLREAISSSLQAMLASFRNNCVQHNPHINYMQLNPLARISVTALMLGLGRQMKITSRRQPPTKQNNKSQQQFEHNRRATVISECEADTPKKKEYDDASERDAIVSVCLFEALIALIENIKQIEIVALIYVETKFIDKFVSEHLLRPDYLATLLHFIEWCCNYIQALLSGHNSGSGSSSSRCLPTLTFEQRHQVTVLLRCLDVLLHQKFIWRALNQPEKVKALHEGASGNGGGDGDSCIGYGLTKCEQNTIICSLLDVVVCAATMLLENTAFYKKYKNALRSEASSKQNFDNETWLAAVYAPKAIFVGKLIETEIGKQFLASANIEFVGGFCNDNNKFKDFNYNVDYIPLQTILSIGVSTLKTHLFYTIAVTPFEIVQEQLKNEFSLGKERISMHTSMSPTKTSHSYQRDEVPAINRSLPVIPIESLSDVDILRSFVKRLSIFGFTTRQQFEEYFMTFLLLINKVYEENMVDQQEQFQIRSTCLEAIMELLITYKTFPIVGNKLLLYHHTTRWSRINCDSISFKKLHNVQLMICGSNVFYHPNLERNLLNDIVIGTHNFWVNQYDLNFIWHRMESSSAQHSPLNEGDGSLAFEEEFPTRKSSPTSVQLDGKTANVAYRNFQYFTTHSGIDYKSSTQLIFDVLMQLIEHNHILVLPNLVKFMEICEDRDQIKQISKKAAYLQSHIPMDDTVSHQHLIYLLCKTNAVLIPTLAEVQHLESLLRSYLKSSHVFIRCATLCGVLSLLECCHKTNTSIGKLSDELDLLKQLSVNYIDKYGVLSESSIQCSDIHTKLVWTLNYCLMEWLWKLDSQFNTSAQVEMAVSKLLKETSNEQIYVCVLHGLERMIVLNNRNCNSVDGQNQLLSSVEKLALELAKVENEKFSIPALKLLVSCIYIGSLKQLENTELSNGIVHDDPEIIVQQTDKVDVLLQCIKTATRETAWIYGKILCQIIRDLVPPKEILTKVIKELLAINHPHSDVIAMIVFQVFRSAIDSSFLQQLQDWLTCSLPTFLSLNEPKAVWSLTVVLLSASINPHLMKLFPLVLNYGVRTATRTNVAVAAAATTTTHGFADDEVTAKLGHHEIGMFVTSAQDFYMKLSKEQKQRFREAFKEFHHIKVYNKMLQSL